MIAAIAVLLLVLAGATAGGIALLNRHSAPGQQGASRPVKRSGLAPATVTVTVTATASQSPSPVASPTVQTFSELYNDVSNGIVRIETTACDGGGVGSGFLVAPDMVATVAHVVAGAVTIAVRDGSTTTTGTVIGYDPANELALIRTATPMTGHIFTLDTAEPEVGTDVGAIGYPLGGDESLSKGAISGLGRRITVEGHRLADLIQTDASINPGNSGGPLLTADGTVVGLVEAKRTDAENIGYAIPANNAAGQLQDWQSSPRTVHWPYGCDAPTGPDGVPVDVTDQSGHADGPAIAQAFSAYVDGINTGDYASAYQVLSPTAQQRTPYEEFSSGNVSSYIVELSVDSVTPNGDGDQVEVRFTSVQDSTYGIHGQTCSAWSMTYQMASSAGTWLIDSATPHPGSPRGC